MFKAHLVQRTVSAAISKCVGLSHVVLNMAGWKQDTTFSYHSTMLREASRVWMASGQNVMHSMGRERERKRVTKTIAEWVPHWH